MTDIDDAVAFHCLKKNWFGSMGGASHQPDEINTSIEKGLTYLFRLATVQVRFADGGLARSCEFSYWKAS